MEEDLSEARADAICPRTSICVCRMEFRRLLQITFSVLEFSISGLSAGCHRTPKAAGVQILHCSLPDVPLARAPIFSSQTHFRVPVVHSGQCCHYLHLHHQDLPVAGQHWNTEVHVVMKNILIFHMTSQSNRSNSKNHTVMSTEIMSW